MSGDLEETETNYISWADLVESDVTIEYQYSPTLNFILSINDPRRVPSERNVIDFHVQDFIDSQENSSSSSFISNSSAPPTSVSNSRTSRSSETSESNVTLPFEMIFFWRFGVIKEEECPVG